ncbi:MAG: hypothetical protein ABI036_04820 [Fibrobacteria bacterium]
MLRKSGLTCVSAVLLWGCDLFSTREFIPKPTEIRSLAGLVEPGDSVAYRVREILWNASQGSLLKTLSRRRLIFSLLADSADGGDSLKLLSLRILDDSSGALLETSVRSVRFSEEGIRLQADSSGGGARFFPLKAAATASKASTAAADGADFRALPGLLVQGWNELAGMGILTVRREQVSVDTLKYQARLEEAWGIRESVLDGDSLMASGMYWYGVSGLLKADQTWPGFDWRDGNGSKPAVVELRRALERL